MRIPFLPTAFFLAVYLIPLMATADASEQLSDWSDSKIPVKSGMVVWLDATRQSAARSAHQRAAVLNNGRVDVWYDGSGNERHLIQRIQDSQPKFLTSGEMAVIRFDGKDDFFEHLSVHQSLESFTIFFVAAPRSNLGTFRGIIACTEHGKNDYITGFNVDLTGNPSATLDRINVEGRGMGGAVDLFEGSIPFGEFHTFEVTARTDPSEARLAVDGIDAGGRDRTPGKITIDEMTIGVRNYSNTAEPPYVSGFFDGDIAEIVLYDHALNDTERQSLAAYFKMKYATIGQQIDSAIDHRGRPLQSVKEPPPVQMFVPGFVVRELPVNLNNINNLRYRHDGKLVAVAYDGNIHVLSDTDRDGVEDHAELFWENSGQIQSPVGVALTPPEYAMGEGVFVACKGKVSLLLDSNRTGRADREIVVAQGWKVLKHSVDALGLALDRDGSIYFGLGTTDFTNAYLVGPNGKSEYDIKGDRGTIQRVSPDFKSRSIVATGIRFAIGMGFNRHGDLFATDQEGATWLPNGNPLDELLHIQKGRHYGFPPRHPVHLLGVIDEPSLFDYGPQHQSTCGLIFNDAVNVGPTFGPKEWESDAFVTGYSRGKLYRTKLVKTPKGYVASNQIIACLNQLPSDVCVSPAGDLLVAVHSGDPDWGSGPKGKGRLYQIHYQDREVPQPVQIWPAGPREIRIAFDRPLDLNDLKDLGTRIDVEYGKYVAAGDRFESLRPGYAVVAAQLAAPRFSLPVHSVRVSPDRRTLQLLTAAGTEPAQYSAKLPRLGPAGPIKKADLPQFSEIDLAFDLSGVSARWESESGTTDMEIWLPHIDLDVSRALTISSAEHDQFWNAISGPGRLLLKTRLDLSNLLRPIVQPGSQIDYTWPAEQPSIVLRSETPFEVKANARVEPIEVTTEGEGWRLTFETTPVKPISIEVSIKPNNKPPRLAITWSTLEDSRERLFPLRRFVLPWANSTQKPTESLVRPDIPELKGGSWARGRNVFYSDQALCSRCHTVAGKGGRIGPDLSNLIHRDYASVLKDIRLPNASINPDHIAFNIELKSGKSMTGLVRRDGQRIIVGDKEGRETTINANEIESMNPSSISIMPEGVEKLISTDRMRDLLTFLLTVPLEPAPKEIQGSPPIRSRQEVESVLGESSNNPNTDRRLHIVLCTGPKDHGPGEHDYPLWRRRWVKLFDHADNVLVTEAEGWPNNEQFADASTIVFYSNNPGWSEERGRQLDTYLQRGGGLVYIHYAVDGHDAANELASRIGLAWKGGMSKFRHGFLELQFPNRSHPITGGFDRIKFEDESYWDLVGDPNQITVLATGDEDGSPRPLMWTREQGQGRIFVSIPGHYNWTFDDPLFRLLLLRGMAWTAGESVDRFNTLVFPGASLRATN